MSARPGHRQNNGEDQCVGGNIQIKVGHAMHQNGPDTPNASQGNGFVKTFFRFPVTMRGSGQDPEDGAKHQNGAGQAKFSGYLQAVAWGVVDEGIEKSGLNGRNSDGSGNKPRSTGRT